MNKNDNMKNKIDELYKKAIKLAGLCFELKEDLEETEIHPLNDGVYIENLNDLESEKTKLMEWEDFWERFFGHYDDECLPVMLALRNELDKNIKGIKTENKYYPIKIGGAYK